MRKLIAALLIATGVVTAQAANPIATRGADISWCTEMEAEGLTFKNADGQATDLFPLMGQLGVNAVRLRVWVNPTRLGYGAWCDKADVLAKAKRAKAQGFDLMIDFHYSDIFADPGTQSLPLDWEGLSLDEVKAALAAHTVDVLQALKDEGIEPKWVQVGNETNNGMSWEAGRIDWNKYGNLRYANYVTLSNAGYQAVKSVFPEASVIVHVAGVVNAEWFFREFKAAGGKFDIMGVSHYPSETAWSSLTDDGANIRAAEVIKKVSAQQGVPVMVCETGFPQHNPAKAALVMRDLFWQLKDVEACAGVFYWEPEVDGQWKPPYYYEQDWGAYRMGAFSSDFKPLATLNAFAADADYTAAPVPTKLAIYDKDREKVLAHLSPVAGKEGVFSGYLSVEEAWLNFQIADEENGIWYGSDPEGADVVSKEEDHWNFWINGSTLGVYVITIDLNTMRWSQAVDESGVTDIKVDDKNTDGPRYNMLGQPVTDDYRGIVLQRGHKTLKR